MLVRWLGVHQRENEMRFVEYGDLARMVSTAGAPSSYR